MKIKGWRGGIEEAPCDMVAVGIYEDDSRREALKGLPPEITRAVNDSIKSREFEGKKHSVRVFDTLGKIRARWLALVGLGKKKEYDLEGMRRAVHSVREKADSLKAKALALHTESFLCDGKEKLCGIALGEGASLGQYSYEKYKKKKENEFHVSTTLLLNAPPALLRWARAGLSLSEDVKLARDMVNEPGNVATPSFLANAARKIGRERGIRVRVYGRKELERMGMNALLAVGRGSKNEPLLIVMELNPGKKGGTALVGKGISFDSGGLNIKPGNYMNNMKEDMAGAASVLAVMRFASKMGYRERLLGILACAENMPSSTAMRPGDVVKSYMGKTIEILNTDAEGRLVLADAVAYAEGLKPKRIIDVATLTGASIVTLGYAATPVISTDDKTFESLESAGKACYERVWRFPLWDEYKDQIKSDIADVQNLPRGKGYEAGVIAGAAFISAFIKRTPWTHLDIGGTSWFPEQAYYVPKNATGIPVRLLTYMLMGWA